MKIYGVFDQDREKTELKNLLKKMESQLNPKQFLRSEDIVKESFGIGHLCFEAIYKDKQPIWNEDKTKFIVMVGKIFDFEEQKMELLEKGHVFTYSDSAAEFVLHGIEEWGNKLIETLNGYFVFLLYDTEKMSVQVVNDRCGMKPLYYFQSGSLFVFASEVKAVIEDNKVEKEVNWEAWRNFFSYGFMMGNKTPFKNIFSLPPATSLTFNNSKELSAKRYWKYAQVKINHESSEQDFISKGTQLLKQAFQRQASHLDKCNVLLSGGCDSRVIASAIRYYTNVQFETLSAKPSHFLDSIRSIGARLYSLLEPIIAEEVARALNAKYTYIPRPSDLYSKYLIEKVFLLDGMCLEHLWILPLVKNLGRDKVTFFGIGGDILLGGCLTTSESLENIGNAKKIARGLDCKLRHFLGYPTELIISLFKDPIREKLVSGIDMLTSEIEAISDNENVVAIFHMENRQKNSISLMPNNLIGKRTSCLFPFLDKDLVEFSLTIPPQMKIFYKIYKPIMFKMFPEIMKIPTVTFPYSVKDWSKKYLLLLPMRLIHSLVTSRSHNAEEVHYLLGILKSLDIPEYIDMEKVEKTIDKYLSSKRNLMPFLVPLVEFCIWYNLFVRKKNLLHLHDSRDKNLKSNAA